MQSKTKNICLDRIFINKTRRGAEMQYTASKISHTQQTAAATQVGHGSVSGGDTI
jgi:hypothetical protein